jgi:hypothetical protein
MDKSACDLRLSSFMVGVKMVHPYLHSGTGVLFAHLKKNERMDKSSKKLGAASYKHTSH